MSIYAVNYVYGGPAHVLATRRPEHREYLRGFVDRGMILASGPLADDVPGALIIVSADSAQEVEQILDGDPLVIHGVVTERRVREWTVAMGTWIANQ